MTIDLKALADSIDGIADSAEKLSDELGGPAPDVIADLRDIATRLREPPLPPPNR